MSFWYENLLNVFLEISNVATILSLLLTFSLSVVFAIAQNIDPYGYGMSIFCSEFLNWFCVAAVGIGLSIGLSVAGAAW